MFIKAVSILKHVLILSFKLTLHNVGDEVQVCADALDLVQTGQTLDGNVLVAVHLRKEVQVAAEALPVEEQSATRSLGRVQQKRQSSVTTALAISA